jgi:hypothetical protein
VPPSHCDCEWCGGSQRYHVGAGNYWDCPICHPRRGRLHGVERERIERRVRPLPPGWQEALERDDALRAAA